MLKNVGLNQDNHIFYLYLSKCINYTSPLLIKLKYIELHGMLMHRKTVQKPTLLMIYRLHINLKPNISFLKTNTVITSEVRCTTGAVYLQWGDTDLTGPLRGHLESHEACCYCPYILIQCQCVTLLLVSAFTICLRLPPARFHNMAEPAPGGNGRSTHCQQPLSPSLIYFLFQWQLS